MKMNISIIELQHIELKQINESKPIIKKCKASIGKIKVSFTLKCEITNVEAIIKTIYHFASIIMIAGSGRNNE